jgi:uncharacterized protein YndB with AHSA1/START domain
MTRAIERTLELEATPEQVWKALTDPQELAGWFGDSAELEPRPGAGGWFGWASHGRFAVRVTEVDPPRRFAWRWMHEPGAAFEEAASTLVEWTLTAREDGGTTLELRESGFRTDLHRQENTEGWEQELQHLVDHLGAGA